MSMVAGRQPGNGAVGLTREHKAANSKNGAAQHMLSLLRRSALLNKRSRVQDTSDGTGSRFCGIRCALRTFATWIDLRHFARARGLGLNLIPVSSTPKRSMIASPLILALACGMLLSCEQTDRSGTTFRTFSALGGESISIDAHQRAIITTEIRDENGQPRLIYCAEPSPDAFASINSILNRSIAAKSEISENTVEVSDDTLSTLESVASAALNTRNATIQLLRDGLYRACEAYATGALSQSEYVGIVGQYQNVILALLSIELLTTINATENTRSDANSGKGVSDESESGRAEGQDQMQVSTSGLGEGSIKIIANTAERLVIRVLGIERERALQPRLAECVQRVREQPNELGTVLIQWCDIMLKHIAKESSRDRPGGSNDTLDLLDEVTAAMVDPAGAIAVGDSSLVHFEDGERLKVFSLKVDMDGIYEIKLSNDSASSDGDPALIVTTADLDVVGSDDDFGPGLNARIEETLKADHYHIHVINVGLNRATFALSVEEKDAGSVEEHSEVDDTESQADPLFQEEHVRVDDIIQDLVDELVEESRAPRIEVKIGVEHELQFTPADSMQSLTFEISSAGNYILEVSTETERVGDPAVILLDEDGGVLDADDDSGGGLNARIERHLPVGDYELRVLNLDSSTAALQVLVVRGEGSETSVRDPSVWGVLPG